MVVKPAGEAVGGVWWVVRHCLLYVITSAFTHARTVRDQPEAASVCSGVDDARLKKLLAEHDPLSLDALSG